MLGGHGQAKIAQFTSTSTAAVATICLGFVPDHVEAFIDTQGTNPNIRYWFNTANFSMWQAGSDDTILDTGATGVLTVDTASIVAYAGGDTVTATDVTNRAYFDAQGNVLAAGTITSAGITIPSGDQVNSGKNVILAIRDSA